MDFVAIRHFTQQVLHFQCLLGQPHQLDGSCKIGSGHPSLCPDVFLQLDNYFFRNFDVVQETQMTLCVKEPIFLKKTSFAPNTVKMGQIWAKNKIFLNLFF